MRRRMRSAWALALVSSLIGGVGVFVLFKVLERDEVVAQRTDAVAQRAVENYSAIIASCEALNNKIRQSQRPPAADSSTALLIGELVKLLPPDKVREFHRRLANERKSGGRLRPANCEAVARRGRMIAERRARQ